MGLEVEERMLDLENQLLSSREEILLQRKKLLSEFTNYAYEIFQKFGAPVFIKYSLMNNSENLKYVDLGMDEKYELKIISFSYMPQSNQIIDYVEKTQSGEKKDPDFLANMNKSGKGMEVRTHQDKSFDDALPLDKVKISIERKKVVKGILEGIFSGRLVFPDEEYKRLVKTNIAIDKELQRLNARIDSLHTDEEYDDEIFDKVKKKTTN